MGKKKKELGFDSDGAKKVMRKRDYMADMSGQLALGLMANVVGQLTYFYTDKVGLAVGGVGIVMAIAKVIDALTDIWFGNVIEHSKGGNSKFYKWMFRMMIPAAVITFLMFTVPKGQTIGMIYVLVTNVLLTAVIYTMIATPFGAVMVVRTNSQVERSNMGIFRAVGNYGAGMIISIIIIPVTNMLGGTQSAWIKFGAILALIVLLLLAICYNNGRKAKYSEDTETLNEVEEEEAVPFKDAIKMLFGNKYWVIVLLFNIITNVTNAIAAASGTYYCKWIFGNDNLVAITGQLGMPAAALDLLSKYEIKDLGTIECQKIELNAPIKETIELDALSTAVGHFEDTPIYNGNVCLAGHNSGTNKNGEDIGFFKRLNELEEGDQVIYHHAFGEYIYKVSEIKEIEETDFSVLEPSTTDKLTLITCVKGQKKLRLCVICDRI